MRELNLPVLKDPLPASRRLSMDEYLEFVLFNLKYTFDSKAYKSRKKLQDVYIPFKLK